MKRLILALLLLATPVFAADPPPAGWGPSAVLNAGAFYANGNYNIASLGVGYGTSYKWTSKGNLNELGIYLGPQITQVGTVNTTLLTAAVHWMLYNNFSIGAGAQIWQNGQGFQAPDKSRLFMLLGYNLSP